MFCFLVQFVLQIIYDSTDYFVFQYFQHDSLFTNSYINIDDSGFCSIFLSDLTSFSEVT
jgi:hypothetical protein